MVPNLTLKLLSRFVTDYEMAFLVLGSRAAQTVESVRNLSRDMFAPIQGELSELTYHW
jgi:hypothetical protein